jgi:hypothetical protein
MNSSLDTLSAVGNELSGDQLAQVDGGLVWLLPIAAMALADGVLWGYILSH